jgi:putative DNA primase/helicase
MNTMIEEVLAELCVDDGVIRGNVAVQGAVKGSLLNGDKEKTNRLLRHLKDIEKFKARFSPDTLGDEAYQYEISRMLAYLPLTDYGNVLRVQARYGDRIRYVSEKSKFYVYDGRSWIEDVSQKHVMTYVINTVGYLEVEGALLPLPTDENGNLLICPQIGLLETPTSEQAAIIKKFAERERHLKALEKWQSQSQSRHSIDATLSILSRSSPNAVSLLDFDTRDYLLNCQNGTLDLQTGELRPHNHKELHMKVTGTNYVPGAKCPYWDAFVAKLTRGDKEVERFLKQIAGQGLAGVQQDDVMVVCYGPGGNGKTVFSEMVKEVIGGYADVANTDLFLAKEHEGISNDRAALVGVRFLTVSETDEGRKLNESLVKGMTGGDKQKVRFLRNEFFTMVPKFTAMLFTNHKPVITGTDEGIWRRVKLVPWLHSFEQDPEREDKATVYAKMRAELPGILNWLYEGYRDRQLSGHLYIPNLVQCNTQDYRRESDTLGEFLEDYCVTDEEHATVPVGDLYMKFREFYEADGFRFAITKKGFAARLKERSDIPYLGQKRTASVRYWTGIRLLENGETKKGPDDLPQKQPDPEPEVVVRPSEPEEYRFSPKGVPTPDQIKNYPADALFYMKDKGRPCYTCKQGAWMPYYSDEIGGGVWRAGCSNCHPEIVESKGRKYRV